jgi:hypothetical protein
VQPGPEDVSEVGAQVGADTEVRCLACSHVATRRALAIEVAGAHIRTFRNPAGWSFQVACYRDAPGCTAAGEATIEHTWFDGYSWRLVHCTNCGRHLGWWFAAPSDAFVGLIAPRLCG